MVLTPEPSALGMGTAAGEGGGVWEDCIILPPGPHLLLLGSYLLVQGFYLHLVTWYFWGVLCGI